MSETMEYRRLGRTGLKVSTVSIGGWVTIGGTVDERASIDILHAAVEQGINFIDVADVYANGACERVLKQFLHEYTAKPGNARSDLVLSTKVFWPMGDGPNDKGLSRKHIMEAIEGSLERAGVDYFDIYFCHRPDPDTPIEETQRAMDDLVHRGKVLYWGTSCWWPEHFDEAWGLADRRHLYGPIVEQPRYNLLDRGIERDVLPTCGKHGMGVVVWSPLAQGILTGKYNDGIPDGSRAATTKWLERDLPNADMDRVRDMCALAEELGCTPAQLALAWCIQQPHITSVITGASRPEQVTSNVAAAGLELPDDVLCKLNEWFPRPA